MKENNANVLIRMFRNNHDSAMELVQSLNKYELYSLLKTNGIFALIFSDSFWKLDIDKKKFVIEMAINDGYEYIPKTLAERCEDCCKILYPEVEINNGENGELYTVVDSMDDYFLDCDSEGLAFGVNISQSLTINIRNLIISGNYTKYMEIHKRIMGKMKINEFQENHIEDKGVRHMYNIHSILRGSFETGSKIKEIAYNNNIITTHQEWYNVYHAKHNVVDQEMDIEKRYNYNIIGLPMFDKM